MSWRTRLLLAIGVVFLVGEIWMFLAAGPALRSSLSVLTAVYLAATAAVFVHYRHHLTPNLLTANVGLGALAHLTLTALVVMVDRLTALGVVPAIAQNWHLFLLGALGITAAFVSWTQARGAAPNVLPPAPTAHREPAPPPSTTPTDFPGWDRATAALARDPRRQRELARLRRIAAVLSADGDAEACLDDGLRVVRQEAQRVLADAAADAREDDDGLSVAAGLLEWGAQKLPELAELDVSDLLMGKVIADIRATHDRVEQRFVDHRELRAIHPIDRATAEEKCNARARAARAALPILRANGMRLSEELIAAHDALEAFRSVTGFQVVELADDGGYVTFEGNGRREALQRAFGTDEAVHVEVRVYVFDRPERRATIDRRVRRVQRWKGVEDVPDSPPRT
jgi:hypothetical protein